MPKNMSVFSNSRLFLWTTQGDASLPINQADGDRVTVNGKWDSRYRLNEAGTAAELKPSMPLSVDPPAIAANNLDEATIFGLPEGTVFTVEGQTEIVEGSSAKFSTDLAGKYTLVFSHPLYLDTSVEVTAV